MIEKLKFLIDECEDNPKLKGMFLKIAELPESKQEAAWMLVEMIVNAKVTE